MGADCENINPYSDDIRGKADQVRDMFDAIAPAYDFMNRAMTLGIDSRWRRRAISMLRRRQPRPAHILDVATGTGDLALMLARRLDPLGICGIDLSEGMLARGREKIAAAGLSDIISLQCADCLQLPFPEGAFDCVTVAYGVRNFEDLEAGYREMFRVLKPGGSLLVVELSTPRSPLVAPLYRFYTSKIIPWLGRLVSHDVSAYSYLPASIAAVPQGADMTAIMQRVGFCNADVKTLTFGACSVYIADKPDINQ